MNVSQFFIAVSIAVLACIALLVFFVGRSRKENRLTPLAGLAFGLVLAGILFGDDRPIGHSLLGIGVTLAVIGMLKRSKVGGLIVLQTRPSYSTYSGYRACRALGPTTLRRAHIGRDLISGDPVGPDF